MCVVCEYLHIVNLTTAGGHLGRDVNGSDPSQLFFGQAKTYHHLAVKEVTRKKEKNNLLLLSSTSIWGHDPVYKVPGVVPSACFCVCLPIYSGVQWLCNNCYTMVALCHVQHG